jgi:acyl-CoA synthetase (AMP-forming)/AMP-acid ligase II
VPLTHRNICVSARNICDALQLVAADRCLNMMPLFHIHGLSMLYASLTAGGSMVCTAGFSPGAFFEWVEAFRPTWYSAAPTIHQFVLETSASNPKCAARCKFRFMRSASAPMPRQVMADLERVFGSPFIEAYGMTEAAPQIASNRLPPFERKIH